MAPDKGMRILWINHRDPRHPEAGGAEVHIAEVGKRLVGKGHEITLLCERFSGSEAEEELYGMRVKRFGGKFTLHCYAPYFVKRNSGDFDVVIDDVAHAVPFWSPKFTRKPVVAIVHHIHQKVVERELNPILAYLVRKAEKSIKNTYDHIIAVSQTTKRDLIKQLGVNGQDVTVIHCGIDHVKYRPGRKFDEPAILWMGRMKKYKNLEHVIMAFKLVKQVVKDAKLILVGAGEEERKIKSLIHREGVKDVTFTGWVSGDDKLRLLQGAWCIVYASETEGWGMGILEAAACGTPAVAYNSGALRESIIDGETGLLAEYGNIKELAQCVLEILSNKGLRKMLSEKALNLSYNFDWDKTAEQTERYLEGLL
jgi:glycosyltransferase involved in cell wall biosynthesis